MKRFSPRHRKEVAGLRRNQVQGHHLNEGFSSKFRLNNFWPPFLMEIYIYDKYTHLGMICTGLLPSSKKNLMNSIIIFTSAKSWPCTKTTPPKLPTCKRPARAKEGALGWFHWVLGNRNLMEIIQHQYEQMKLMGGFLCQIWHAPCHHHHRHPPSSS